MIYILYFIFSILLNVFCDNIILYYLQNCYSQIFISFFLYFCGFFFIFLFKKKISFKRENVFRSILCSIAILLTWKAYQVPGIDVISLASMYYMIPIFESVIYIMVNKEYNWKSFLSITFNIICFTIFCNKNIPISGIIGCFLFSLSDILITKSNSKDHLLDTSSVAFFSCIFFLCLGFIKQGKYFLQYSFNNQFLWCAGIIWVLSDILVFYAYKYTDPIKLSPFRYIDLVILNSYNNLVSFNIVNLFTTKTVIPFIFMIIRLII